MYASSVFLRQEKSEGRQLLALQTSSQASCGQCLCSVGIRTRLRGGIWGYSIRGGPRPSSWEFCLSEKKGHQIFSNRLLHRRPAACSVNRWTGTWTRAAKGQHGDSINPTCFYPEDCDDG